MLQGGALRDFPYECFEYFDMAGQEARPRRDEAYDS